MGQELETSSDGTETEEESVTEEETTDGNVVQLTTEQFNQLIKKEE